MKPGLQLRLGQQLAMTPQLRQALELLQLSSLELQETLAEALESNVMLEVEEPDEPAGPEWDDNPEDAEFDAWRDRNTTAQPDWGRPPADAGERQELAETGHSLREHLLWQQAMCPFSERDATIAVALIDALDDDGYLREDVSSVVAALGDEFAVDEDEIEAVRHRIQHFDPLGVAARDLRECLLIQLQVLPEATPGKALAYAIVDTHLEALGRESAETLSRRLGATPQELSAAVELIRSLDPRPGGRIAPREVEYVIPDVTVRRGATGWTVELNPELAPRLKVNAAYASSLDGRGSSHPEIRRQLQEARWLIRSLDMRNETLMRVADCIARMQAEFMTHGEVAMRPMVLRDVAEQLDMHESTVSRVTTHKYMLTPRGIYEFKYFFSSHVSTTDGGACSATAIRAMIRALIAEENPRKPLSDGKIAETLMHRGIEVARRTVAKYRESMTIPPSHERKRLVMR